MVDLQITPSDFEGLNGSNPTLKEDPTIPEDCLIEMKAKDQKLHSH